MSSHYEIKWSEPDEYGREEVHGKACGYSMRIMVQPVPSADGFEWRLEMLNTCGRWKRCDTRDGARAAALAEASRRILFTSVDDSHLVWVRDGETG